VPGGKAGPGRGHKTGSNATRLSPYSAAYTLARLDRDDPKDRKPGVDMPALEEKVVLQPLKKGTKDHWLARRCGSPCG